MNIKKILFISLHTKRGYEQNDVVLSNFLNKRFSVDFAAASHKFQKSSSNFLYNKGHKTDELFIKANTFWFDNFYEIKLKILEYDIVILSSLKQVTELIYFSRQLKKKVIIIDTQWNYDFDKNILADLFVFKNIFSARRYIYQNKNYESYKLNYKIAGYPEIQSLSQKKISELSFRKKYKIKKKLALILSNGPQYFVQKYYVDILEKIKKTLFNNNFEIITKYHPTFFNQIKIKNLNFPKKFNVKNPLNVKSIKENDFINSIDYADIIVAISSNSSQIVNLRNKPIIFIERQNFLSDNKFKNNPVIKSKDSTLKVRKFSVNNFIKKNSNSVSVKSEKVKEMSKFMFYGCEIDIENFDNFLKKKHYKFKIHNKIKNDIYKLKSDLLPFDGLEALKQTRSIILNFINNSNLKKNNLNIYFYKVNLFFLSKLKKISDLLI